MNTLSETRIPDYTPKRHEKHPWSSTLSYRSPSSVSIPWTLNKNNTWGKKKKYHRTKLNYRFKDKACGNIQFRVSIGRAMIILPHGRVVLYMYFSVHVWRIDCSQPSIFSFFFFRSLNPRIGSRENWTPAQKEDLTEWRVGIFICSCSLLCTTPSPTPACFALAFSFACAK